MANWKVNYKKMSKSPKVKTRFGLKNTVQNVAEKMQANKRIRQYNKSQTVKSKTKFNNTTREYDTVGIKVGGKATTMDKLNKTQATKVKNKADKKAGRKAYRENKKHMRAYNKQHAKNMLNPDKRGKRANQLLNEIENFGWTDPKTGVNYSASELKHNEKLMAKARSSVTQKLNEYDEQVAKYKAKKQDARLKDRSKKIDKVIDKKASLAKTAMITGGAIAVAHELDDDDKSESKTFNEVTGTAAF